MIDDISKSEGPLGQGLSLRGDGDELQSNFYQLMLLQGEQCPEILSFLEKKQLKYTSHEIQNEILSIMAQAILRRLVRRIQSSVFFTLMVDETTDISNREQVVLVFRWVEDDLTVHEDFLVCIKRIQLMQGPFSN